MDAIYNRIGMYPGIKTDNNVISYLYRHVTLFPEKIALQWVSSGMSSDDPREALPHNSVTYGELTARIKRVAGGFRALGINKGDRVLIFLPMSVPMYVVMFAVQQVGAAAVFLDSWARRDQLSVSAEIVTPKAMISFEKVFELVRPVPALESVPIKVVSGTHFGEYTAALEELLAADEDNRIEPVAGEDTALITFTTGSSGRPKGADRTHRFLASQHKALDGHLPYGREDVDLPYFPIFSLNNLAGGVTTVLPAVDLAQPGADDPARIVNQIRHQKVTCCTLSPAIFNSTAQFCLDNGISLDGLRRVVTGGAPVNNDMVSRFKQATPKAEVLVLYGSTEVEPIAHINAEELSTIDNGQEGVCVGHLDPALKCRIIGIQRGNVQLAQNGWPGLEMPKGKPGELVVCGDHVCRAYINDPEATRRAKIFEKDGTVWHRTGDVGLLDSENRLWLQGRVHNTIIRKGAYIFPVHAEFILKRLPFTDKAAFVGLPDPEMGERACAVVSLMGEARQKSDRKYEAEIRETLLEGGIIVDEVRILEDIPMDSRHHSKVEYSALRDLLSG